MLISTLCNFNSEYRLQTSSEDVLEDIVARYEVTELLYRDVVRKLDIDPTTIPKIYKRTFNLTALVPDLSKKANTPLFRPIFKAFFESHHPSMAESFDVAKKPDSDSVKRPCYLTASTRATWAGDAAVKLSAGTELSIAVGEYEDILGKKDHTPIESVILAESTIVNCKQGDPVLLAPNSQLILLTSEPEQLAIKNVWGSPVVRFPKGSAFMLAPPYKLPHKLHKPGAPFSAVLFHDTPVILSGSSIKPIDRIFVIREKEGYATVQSAMNISLKGRVEAVANPKAPTWALPYRVYDAAPTYAFQHLYPDPKVPEPTQIPCKKLPEKYRIKFRVPHVWWRICFDPYWMLQFGPQSFL